MRKGEFSDSWKVEYFVPRKAVFSVGRKGEFSVVSGKIQSAYSIMLPKDNGIQYTVGGLEC